MLHLSNLFTYHSFAPERHGNPSGKGKYEEYRFTSFEAAQAFAKNKDYDYLAEYQSDAQTDILARLKARQFDNTPYTVAGHNCEHMVNSMMDVIQELYWFGSGHPYETFKNNLYNSIKYDVIK